jgi:hypothetical protein
MAADHPGDEQIWQNLAQVMNEHRRLAQKAPLVTDQDILRAMLGKPWSPQNPEPASARKAG